MAKPEGAGNSGNKPAKPNKKPILPVGRKDRSAQRVFVADLEGIEAADLPLAVSYGTNALRIRKVAAGYQAVLVTPDGQISQTAPTPALAAGNLVIYLAYSAKDGSIPFLTTGVSAEARPPVEVGDLGDFLGLPEDWEGFFDGTLPT